MSNKRNIVFSGELRDGFSAQTVADALARTTKLSNDKIKQLLQVNHPVTIHKNLSQEVAEKYRQRYGKLGLVVEAAPCPQAKAGSPPLEQKTSTKIVQQDKEKLKTKESRTKHGSPPKQKVPRRYTRAVLVLLVLTLLVGYSGFTLFQSKAFFSKDDMTDEGRLAIGPFTARYYKEQKSLSTEPEFLLSEEVSTPAINLDGLSSRSFLDIPLNDLYIEWEGFIEVFNNQKTVYANFDVSWSEVSFSVDGQLIDSWENLSKRISLDLPPGKHTVTIQYHNNYHAAGFNLSFNDKQQIASFGQIVQKLGELNLASTKSAFIGLHEAKNNRFNQLTVTVPETNSPVILFLHSTSAINWIIQNPPKTNIAAICLLSRQPGNAILMEDKTIPVFEISDIQTNNPDGQIPPVIGKLIGKQPDFVFQQSFLENSRPIQVHFE